MLAALAPRSTVSRIRASRIYSKLTRAKMSTLPRLPVFEAIAAHNPKHLAVVHSNSGRKFTYGELLRDAADAKEKLASASGGLSGQRIAFLVENSYDYVGAASRSMCGSRQAQLYSDTSCRACKRCHSAATVSQFSGFRATLYPGEQRSAGPVSFREVQSEGRGSPQGRAGSCPKAHHP